MAVLWSTFRGQYRSYNVGMSTILGCSSYTTAKMNKYECEMDQKLGRTLLHMSRADALCALTRRQHFYAWNDVTAAILKVWRQIENPTPSIDAYLLWETNPVRFHPDPIWNDGTLGCFLKSIAPTTTKRTLKTSSYMRSVPDLKRTNEPAGRYKIIVIDRPKLHYFDLLYNLPKWHPLFFQG